MVEKVRVELPSNKDVIDMIRKLNELKEVLGRNYRLVEEVDNLLRTPIRFFRDMLKAGKVEVKIEYVPIYDTSTSTPSLTVDKGEYVVTLQDDELEIFNKMGWSVYRIKFDELELFDLIYLYYLDKYNNLIEKLVKEIDKESKELEEFINKLRSILAAIKLALK